MWIKFCAHIIGDHRGRIWIFCKMVSVLSIGLTCDTPCTDFRKCVLGIFPHSMFPIAANCWRTPHLSNMVQATRHQTYQENPISLRLGVGPACPRLAHVSCVFLSKVTFLLLWMDSMCWALNLRFSSNASSEVNLTLKYYLLVSLESMATLSDLTSNSMGIVTSMP